MTVESDWAAMVAAAMLAAARSPLGHRAEEFANLATSTGGQVSLAELPFMTTADLRVDPTSAAAIEEVLGFSLPGPNRASGVGPYGAVWMGPDEWLITGPPAFSTLVPALSAALPAGSWPASVVDVSANRTALWLGGDRGRDVLAKGCALDLHPRATDVQEPATWWSAVTLVSRVNVVMIAQAGAFLLLVRPSFAGYLADWLLDAAAEYA